jgi:hypothetical protein
MLISLYVQTLQMLKIGSKRLSSLFLIIVSFGILSIQDTISALLADKQGTRIAFVRKAKLGWRFRKDSRWCPVEITKG